MRPSELTKLRQAMDAYRRHGTKQDAALELGIARSTLHDRLKKAERLLDADGNPKAPSHIDAGLRELLNNYTRPAKPEPKRVRQKDPHLLEISIYDAHFGKLCWGAQVGEDYDLSIAEKSYCNAADELIDRVQGFAIDKISVPIGQDFFNQNTWRDETLKGTRVESVDDRFSRVFMAGCRAVEHLVDRCRQKAHTEVLWVPGNHDYESSWYLVNYLGAVYRYDEHVSVDLSPHERKYRLYGVNLFGYVHGNEERHRDLPLLMATEVPDLWGESKCRAWHVGHFHKKKQTNWISTDTYNGVSVRIMPSISGTDAWHYNKGYVQNDRAAEAWLHSACRGYTGHFSVALN